MYCRNNPINFVDPDGMLEVAAQSTSNPKEIATILSLAQTGISVDGISDYLSIFGDKENGYSEIKFDLLDGGGKGDGAAIEAGAKNSNTKGVWQVTNKWNSNYIKGFGDFLVKFIYEKKDRKFTCEDFAIEAIIRHAQENNLPFKWKTGAKQFDASKDSYENLEAFIRDVKLKTGAPDFQTDENTNNTSVPYLMRGTILLNLENSKAHHVQVIYSLGYKDGNLSALLIAQGNFIITRFLRMIYASPDPSHFNYVGARVQFWVYNLMTDTWYDKTKDRTTTEFSKKESLQYVNFNFLSWNN
jgi:hypothetical protein